MVGNESDKNRQSNNLSREVISMLHCQVSGHHIFQALATAFHANRGIIFKMSRTHWIHSMMLHCIPMVISYSEKYFHMCEGQVPEKARDLKGIIHPEMKDVWWFAHPHVGFKLIRPKAITWHFFFSFFFKRPSGILLRVYILFQYSESERRLELSINKRKKKNNYQVW